MAAGGAARVSPGAGPGGRWAGPRSSPGRMGGTWEGQGTWAEQETAHRWRGPFPRPNKGEDEVLEGTDLDKGGVWGLVPEMS